MNATKHSGEFLKSHAVLSYAIATEFASIVRRLLEPCKTVVQLSPTISGALWLESLLSLSREKKHRNGFLAIPEQDRVKLQ